MALASIQENDMTTSQPVGQVHTTVSGQSFTVGQSWGSFEKSLERVSNSKSTKR